MESSYELIFNSENKNISESLNFFPRKFLNNTFFHEFNFNKNDKLDIIFDKVIGDWNSFYLNEKIESFVLVFNTKNLPSNIGVNYVFKMVGYGNKIKNLRKKNSQYNKLNGTIIMIENNSLRNLVNMLFNLSKPLSNVYITGSVNDMNTLINCLKYNKDKTCYPKKVRVITP